MAERDRKAEHIRLALEQRMQSPASHFDRFRFDHEALPEIAGEAIDLSVSFLGRSLRAPLLISCMTGGTGMAETINRHLAIAAEEKRVAIGVGSQRKALEDPSQAYTFQIRELAPSVPLLANLGAVQLNYGYGLDECEAVVEMIGADALVLHLNALQEAIQPEGQTDFSGLLAKIGAIARDLSVPVVVKEVGCGLSRSTAQRLLDVGVRMVDTAGVGGTSWARIEAARAEDASLGEIFGEWGLPTPESIEQVASVSGMAVIGSGGVRNGLDVAKALALGATVVGLAYPFLAPALRSPKAVSEMIDRITRELRTAMLCTGVGSVAALRELELVKVAS